MRGVVYFQFRTQRPLYSTNISYSFTYDALNRNTIAADSSNRTISYAYDKNSNRLFRTDPAGGITQYTYNLLNMIATISSPLGQTSQYTYDNLRRRTKLSLPNNVAISYNYDSLSRLINIINGNIANNSYTNDRVGNRTSMTDAIGTHNYTYDQIYRLTQAAHPAIPAEQFSYDPVGNRQNSTVDAANRLLGDNNYTYFYDNNGNLIQKVSKSTGAVTAYAYDSENRLIQLTTPNAQLVIYKYDPFGRRIEKFITDTTTGTVTTTRYVYDREDILFELDESGNIVTEYLHGAGIDEPIAMIRNNQTYYYHADGLGSIIAITNSSGNVVQRYEYDSFGEITYQQDPNFKQPYTYTSREYDEESGLYYYRARYYDPKIGRFLTTDPLSLSKIILLKQRSSEIISTFAEQADNDAITYPQVLNAYLYVGQNPVNWIDPFGLERIENGLIYDDDGRLIGELPLEDPNPFLDPINYIGGFGGGSYKLGKACLLIEGKKGSRLFQMRSRKTGDVLFRLDKDKKGFHYHRYPDPSKHRPREGGW